MGFRGKQIATITLVAAAVALATILINAAVLTRTAVRQTRSWAELQATTLYHQARDLIRERGMQDLRAALGSAPALRSYAQAVVGYSEVTLYLAIIDPDGQILFHSDPRQEGKQIRPAESITEFSARPALGQFWSMMQSHRVLVVDLPFGVEGDRPACSARVALSTLLLRREILGNIAVNASIAAGLVLTVFLASFYMANRLLAPIEMLRRELGRIDLGQDQPRLDLRNTEDLNRVAEFFASVSHRLAQDRQLRETEHAWLETMLSGLADAVLVINEQRRILSLNASARNLFPQPAEGRTPFIGGTLPRSHPLRAVVDETFDRGEPITARAVRLQAGGRGVPHMVAAQVLRESGQITGVVVTARDMERLSRLGSHLSYTQKLAALGQLTSGVAHEIKNPLNALVLHATLLKDKCDAPEAHRHLDALDREVRRLERVVDGFLKFTRPEQPRFEAVRLERVLDESLALVASRAGRNGIRIERAIPADFQPVYGDRDLLQQAFYNLLLNAFDAIAGNGMLRVGLRRGNEGATVVTIEDSGSGIPPEALPRIFDLYYTTKKEGNGIGLSVTYRIVQLHGGEISVDSEVGRGSRFTVTLPEVRG